MADDFADNAVSLESPGDTAVAVTPSDDTDLTDFTRALWVGVIGDVSLDTTTGQTAVVFKNVSGWLPMRVARVRATGTTATDIVAVR